MKQKLFYFSLLLLPLFALYHGTHFQKTRQLLIVGCARSGTLYISNVLKACGVHIRHERMGREGMSACDFAVMPKVGRWRVKPEDYQFRHIFHQIRDPLKVISSTYITEDIDSWHFIIKTMPQIHVQDPHLVKCAKYWYYWNLAAESIAEWSYRLEDLDEKWDEFQERSELKLSHEVMRTIPRNTHSWGTENRKYFTWQDLQEALEPDLYQKICRLAKRYGYFAPDPDL